MKTKRLNKKKTQLRAWLPGLALWMVASWAYGAAPMPFRGQALYKACEEGNLKAAQSALLDKNEEYIELALLVRDGYGATPLHRACYRGVGELVEFLVAQGAQVNVQCSDKGLTPLHEACFSEAQVQEKERIVKCLLAHRDINVNVQDKAGCTPLHIACEKGSIKLARLLISHANVELSLADHRGQTPLDVTQKEEIKKLLQSKGARPGGSKWLPQALQAWYAQAQGPWRLLPLLLLGCLGSLLLWLAGRYLLGPGEIQDIQDEDPAVWTDQEEAAE